MSLRLHRLSLRSMAKMTLLPAIAIVGACLSTGAQAATSSLSATKDNNHLWTLVDSCTMSGGNTVWNEIDQYVDDGTGTFVLVGTGTLSPTLTGPGTKSVTLYGYACDTPTKMRNAGYTRTAGVGHPIDTPWESYTNAVNIPRY